MALDFATIKEKKSPMSIMWYKDRVRFEYYSGDKGLEFEQSVNDADWDGLRPASGSGEDWNGSWMNRAWRQA